MSRRHAYGNPTVCRRFANGYLDSTGMPAVGYIFCLLIEDIVSTIVSYSLAF